MSLSFAPVSSQPKADSFLPFMAVEFDTSIDPSALQSLTPRIMPWSENVWLLDISSCQAYWQSQAKQHNMSISELWRTLLSQTCGATFRAALSDHPWTAVVLLSGMRERKLNGLVHNQGPFGQTIFREVSWASFWRETDTVLTHMQNQGRKAPRSERYFQQKHAMQKAMQRLSMSHPWQLKHMSPTAIKRRFGKTLETVWQWSYGTTAAETSPSTPLFGVRDHVFASGFPWQSHVFAELPTITRHLDYPLCEWSHLEPVLEEDLDRLCSLPTWQAGERVVSLEWRIVFRDLTHLTVPVLFRHPHSLHQEKTHQRTALLQALYAFENAIPGSPLDIWRFGKDDPAVPAVPIISWNLTVTERLTLPNTTTGLFGDMTAGDSKAAELLDLENRLAVPLEAYDLCNDWVAEDSFQTTHEQENLYASGYERPRYRPGDSEDPRALPSLAALGQARPLFLFRKPYRLEPAGRSSIWQFTERSMDKWWAKKDENAGAMQRDYYRLLDGEQNSYWVYRDNREPDAAYVHGVYG